MSMVQHACLTCPEGSKRFSRVRGLCHGCYQTALARVNAGETTWAALAAAGMARETDKETGRRNPRRVIDFRDMPARHKRGY